MLAHRLGRSPARAPIHVQLQRAAAIALAAVGLSLTACDPVERCGPRTATVATVIDGDTIILETGERIRYLMVDTPEITNGKNECYGAEAKSFNEDLVLGQKVRLRYDVECVDRFDRLLAYVSIDDREINSLLVERGYACVLTIAPNGADREDEFIGLEAAAKSEMRGMWGTCTEVACE